MILVGVRGIVLLEDRVEPVDMECLMRGFYIRVATEFSCCIYLTAGQGNRRHRDVAAGSRIRQTR